MTELVVLFVASGILLIALAIPMTLRKVKPNGWYGVRVPATLGNEQVWYAANAYGGRCLLICGVIWTACSLLFALIPGITADAFSLIMLAMLAVTLIPAVVLIVRRIRRITAGHNPPGGSAA